jgi:DNA relaxase NicK
MKEIITAQNERILTLQMLVEALVDELIETKKVKEKKLDARFHAKMEWAKEQLDKAKQEVFKESNFHKPNGRSLNLELRKKSCIFVY